MAAAAPAALAALAPPGDHEYGLQLKEWMLKNIAQTVDHRLYTFLLSLITACLDALDSKEHHDYTKAKRNGAKLAAKEDAIPYVKKAFKDRREELKTLQSLRQAAGERFELKDTVFQKADGDSDYDYAAKVVEEVLFVWYLVEHDEYPKEDAQKALDAEPFTTRTRRGVRRLWGILQEWLEEPMEEFVVVDCPRET